MSDDRRKANRPSTGTVPKIKPHSGIGIFTDQERSRNQTNNLVGFRGHPPDSINTINNRRRNQQNNYFTMDATLEQPGYPLTQNGTVNMNTSGEFASGNTSSTVSRRNSTSSALKCDNITKYPDKKQIEHKLEQIREYLKITNSLMTSMGNTDEQTDQSELDILQKMFNDLVDSEKKLVSILEQWDNNYKEDTEQIMENNHDRESIHSGTSSCRKNDFVGPVDSSQEMDILREQQMALLQLQQQAENKLRQARQIQSNLLGPQSSNQSSRDNNLKESKSFLDFDVAIRELEERSKRLRSSNSQVKTEDNIMVKVESLQEEISQMHDANDERERLIRTLDNQDAELRSQHAELQTKLSELQNKKMQVDRLVEQLQSFGDEDDEDVGSQVRKICTMKDQLTKLKDMLEIVKTTENIMENTNASEEAQAQCMDICLTAENYLEKDVKKCRLPVKYENQKQVNKNSGERDNRAGKQNSFNFSQKVALQNELESKKRELEEIMGRHKASTSNLNHDVGVDTKSEFSNCTSNTNEAWFPMMSQIPSDFDRFSSDECQDDYTPISDNHNVISLPCQNYSPSNSSKQRGPENFRRHEYVPTPDVNAASYVREQPRSNSEQDKRSQVQKQLQLIKSVCDSMLEQQQQHRSSSDPPPPPSNVHQLRNNLTPSPAAAPTPTYDHRTAAPYDVLATHSAIQTQSFMLGTLNQCCHMLWAQQREIAALKGGLAALQETVAQQGRERHVSPPPPVHPSPSRPAPKANHVSAAFSLPDLNQYNPPPSNLLPSNMPPSNLPNVSEGGNDLLSVDNLLLHATNNLLHAGDDHLLPNQMWAGRAALNNQVAPGIRANNYWDNFRSYSRQNLLSSKNIESLPNLPAPLAPPVPLQPPPKSNSDQASGRPHAHRPAPTHALRLEPHAPCQEQLQAPRPDQLQAPRPDPPHAHRPEAPHARRPELSHAHRPLPPDVLNVNHEAMGVAAPPLDLSGGYSDVASERSNVSGGEERGAAAAAASPARKNHWRDDEQANKSKLFDELRDNVFKMVASLISANETRPQFLIQLFRDLQMISSDSLRVKILQSIQAVVSNSMAATSGPSLECRGSEVEVSHQVADISPVQPTVWSRSIKNSPSSRSTNDSTTHQDMFQLIASFLQERDSEVVQSQTLASFKKILLESGVFREAVKHGVFHKHISNVLDEVFEQYCGKKVGDIRSHLLRTVNELLWEEIDFIQFIQENEPGNLYENASFLQLEEQKNVPSTGQGATAENMQNGDLAEADQSRLEEEDIEEEGAVGGILDQNYVSESHEISQDNFEDNLDLTSRNEGLDQVPTRLLTKSISRSTTPSRDRSNSRTGPDSF